MVLEVVESSGGSLDEDVIWNKWIGICIGNKNVFCWRVEVWGCFVELIIFWVVIEFVVGESLDFKVYGDSIRRNYLIEFCF